MLSLRNCQGPGGSGDGGKRTRPRPQTVWWPFLNRFERFIRVGAQLENKLLYSPVTCEGGERVHSGACDIDDSREGGRVLSTRDCPIKVRDDCLKRSL